MLETINPLDLDMDAWQATQSAPPSLLYCGPGGPVAFAADGLTQFAALALRLLMAFPRFTPPHPDAHLGLQEGEQSID